jgi:hypothetical protein
MTDYTIQTTSSTTWTNVADTSTGYFELEDGINQFESEAGLLLQQEGAVAIATADWQDLPAISTTTWTVQ